MVFVILIVGAICQLLNAQWSTNPAVNNSISTANNTQYKQKIVSDGSGGAIITWVDYRTGDGVIYVQKIDHSGIARWTTNGIAVSTISSNQYSPAIISDGFGGAIITWTETRTGVSIDIYAQKINASGIVQWTANGVAITTISSDERTPEIVGDGIGGGQLLHGRILVTEIMISTRRRSMLLE